MTDEQHATFEEGEPEPPYVDDSPPAAPDEIEEAEPVFQPRNDVVTDEPPAETDPESETPAGVEP